MLLHGIEIDGSSPEPVYRQIAAAVRDAALSGRLKGGVNRNTVVAAYEMLAAEGRVQSHTGRGTFLIPRTADEEERAAPAADPETWFTAFSRAVDGAVSGGLQSIYQLAIASEGVSFVGSYPTGELLPVRSFGEAMEEVLRVNGESALSYGPTAGYPPLRETIAAAMSEKGSTLGPERVLVTNGAQQALALVFGAFLERGDPVVIEEPTYTGALSVLSSIGARPVGVPVDEEGIRTDLLTLALERHRPRLLYVQPTFQNPTTSVMTEERRREVLALARRHRCMIVEDDWAGDLRFEGRDLPTLHALDGGRHVVYLSTFSKKLMPGLRVGWLAALPVVIERLVELKRIQDCGTSPLLQQALDVFLRKGGLTGHLDRIRPAYRQRRDAMLEALQRHFPGSIAWTRPSGGLFIWVTLPRSVDGNELFDAARQQGVLYSRGELFHSDGSGRNNFRLTYSAAPLAEIEEGMATLGRLIQRRWPEREDGPTQRSVETMPIF